VHLSDTHCIRATRNPVPSNPLNPHRKDLVNSFRILEAAVARINDTVKPDFVVVTGDVVDRPSDLAALRRAKAIFDKLKCPYYPVIGNHDSRRHWATVFGRERLHYTFHHSGWRFVAIDSNPNRAEKATLEWLEARLAEQPTTPTALLLHHPLVMPELYQRLFRRFYGHVPMLHNPAAVLAILARHRNVRGTFAGHCHLPIEVTAKGCTHFTAAALVEPGHLFHVVRVEGESITRETLPTRLE